MPARPGSGTRQPDGPPPPGGWDLAASYRAHERRVYRTCLAILHDPAAAEDATQETFIRVGPHLHGVSEARLGSYLATIARNVSTDELRRRGSRRRAMDELHRIEPVLEPEAVAVDRHLVATTWNRLATRERALFLYRFAGYTYEEIALRFGISANAVRKSLVRARIRARQLLEGAAALGWISASRVRRALHTRTRRTPRRLPPARAARIGRLAPPGVRSVVLAAVAGAGISTAGIAAAQAGAGAMPAPALMAHAVAAADSPAQLGIKLVSLAASVDGRTLLGSGYPQPGCELAGCAVLERSDDGGSSWHRVPAHGFAGGTVLLSHGDPRERTLFASGPEGLQRSDDGGISFRTVVPDAAPAGVLLGAGPARLVVASTPARIYAVATGRVVTASPRGWPRGVTAVVPAADGGVLVAAPAGGAPRPPVTSVLHCDLQGACHPLLTVASALRLVAGPRPGGPVLAVAPEIVYVAPVPGAAFGPPITLGGEIGGATVMAAEPSGLRLIVSLIDAGHRARLVRLDEIGLAPPAITPLDADVTLPLAGDLTLGADGRLLAALAVPDALGRWGVRCSLDGGLDWQTSC